MCGTLLRRVVTLRYKGRPLILTSVSELARRRQWASLLAPAQLAATDACNWQLATAVDSRVFRRKMQRLAEMTLRGCDKTKMSMSVSRTMHHPGQLGVSFLNFTNRLL